jgi:uncharacterized protein involved in exopolysaccharide biosynthesis
MEFYRIWRVLLSGRWMIIGLTVMSTLASVGLTYALPPVYEANALVLVRPKEPIKFSANRGETAELLDFPVSQSAPIDTPSKTYIEVIQSQAVAEKIVRALNLDMKRENVLETAFERWRDEFKTWLKELIRSIQHIAKYGEVIPATPFERAVEDVQKNLSVEVRKNTYAFVITYKAADPELAAKVANKASEIFLEHNAHAYRDEARTRRELVEKELRESGQVLLDARLALKRFKSDSKTFSLNEEYSEKLKIISGLELALEKLESELAGLLEGYSHDNSKVSRVQAQISKLRQLLAKHHAELETLPEREKMLNTLDLAVTVAEENYKLIKQKYDEYRIREQTLLNEIRIVSPAEPPLYPTKPIKILYGILGLILALVLGMALMLFLEYINPRVRIIEDLSDSLGLVVLAGIPTMKPRRNS